ncbi:MAG: outer membrane beta-barrel protein [Turneriella sp.]|nr:outer membrane beta-barrel protein [Turneriella sp.]
MRKDRKYIWLFFLVAAQLSYAAKAAQQPAAKSTTNTATSTSRLGIDFSYSESLPHIGVWWHISQQVALRPTLGFRSTTSSSTTNTGFSTVTTETSATIFEFGLSLPVYLTKFKAMDLFVAPAFSFRNTSTKTSGGGISQSESKSGFAFGLSLGLQIPLHEQLHVFGESGFGYSKDDSKKETNLGLIRTSVGAIFYFN